MKRVIVTWTVLAAVAACRSLPDPDQLPLPRDSFVPPLCGNGMLDPGERCELNVGPGYGRCGAPSSAEGCQLQCVTASCPKGWTCDARHVCERLGGWTQYWSGTLAFSGQALTLTAFDGDSALDLVGVTSEGVHVRLGDGSGGFGPTIDLPPPAAFTGPVLVADVDSDGVDDVVGTVAGAVDVLRADHAGHLVLAASLPVSSAEQVLGIVTLERAGPRRLVLLVETAAGRVLRFYPAHAGGAYVALEAVDVASPRLAAIGVPVRWDDDVDTLPGGIQAATVDGNLGGAMLWLGTIAAPPSVMESFYGPTGCHVESMRTAHHREADPVIRVYASTSCGVFARIGYPGTSYQYSSTPAASNVVEFDVSPLCHTLGFVARDGSLRFADAVAESQPVEPILTTITAPLTATALRTGDLDGDGLTDLVLADGSSVVVLRGKGDLSP